MGRLRTKHLILLSGEEGKSCSKCKRLRPLSSFGPNSHTSDNLTSRCRECQALDTRKNRENNRENVNKRQNERYAENQEFRRKYAREYAQKNKEQIKKSNQLSYEKYKEERLVKAKKYRIANQVLVNERAIRYRNEKKQREGSLFSINAAVSEGIRQSLKSGKCGAKWEKLVGFSKNDLYYHLERLFDNKMSWNNYGSGCGQDRWWEIDHVKGIRHFNFKSVEDSSFQQCWSLSNLRPRWKEENRAWKLDDRIT